jgi:hypothetical protein
MAFEADRALSKDAALRYGDFGATHRPSGHVARFSFSQHPDKQDDVTATRVTRKRDPEY